MFQSYDETGGPEHTAERTQRLRDELMRRGLAGFIVPRAGEYQDDYVRASSARLLWLTGFSGSWGIAVVLRDKAALFTDGRYTLQAQAQVDQSVYAVVKFPETAPSEWLSVQLRPGERIGYDPRLHSMTELKRLERGVKKAGAELVAQADSPIDAIWPDPPARPLAPVTLHPLVHAGQAAEQKIAAVQQSLQQDHDDAMVLTAPDSIAWLFNIRGADVAHTPIVLSFAIVPASGKPELFIDPRKIGGNVRGALGEIAAIYEPALLQRRLAVLGEAKARVRLDPGRTPVWFAQVLQAAGAQLSKGQDPCLLPKATKNAAEIAGARAAHQRDGAAMCRFLAWLDAHASSGEIDEIAAAGRLEASRVATGALRDISFDTISGAGPNGAIVHYRVTRSSNRKLEPGTLYLVDSGGQYLDGTTDITRTITIGAPAEEMRRHFTLVLKGHIAIATARFPQGTRGLDLDAFARRALWQAGLDYEHGTGHGVGSYLSVHEGPQILARRGKAELAPGMILSNEPGYYREGHYGIRIENLLLVTGPRAIEGGEKAMLEFETLTLVPIDRRLIEPGLLPAEELGWVNAYHARVRDRIGALLDGGDKAWLESATAAIAPAR